MSKFKYNDKVEIIKDLENDGFFVGLKGVVVSRSVVNEMVTYCIKYDDCMSWVKADEIKLCKN